MLGVQLSAAAITASSFPMGIGTLNQATTAAIALMACCQSGHHPRKCATCGQAFCSDHTLFNTTPPFGPNQLASGAVTECL